MVDIQTLIQKRVVSDPDDYRIYSNLRRRLQGSLVNKNGQDVIQNDGSKRYRISAHPDFITYKRGKLLKHPHERVRRIAERLPRH